MVADRRERRMAVRLGAEHAALPGLDDRADPAEATPHVELPSAAVAGTQSPADAPQLDGDDDDDEEIFDAPDDGFYDDAFEVLS